MPATTIVIPDFRWSGFYYPEILEDLIQYVRQNVPELTDEDPREPFIQLLRAFSLSAHLNNVLLDIVAKERFIPTLRLRASLRNHLALIDVDLAQATPASADVAVRLTRQFTSVPATVIPAGSVFATEGTQELSAIDFERLADVVINLRTDLVGRVFAFNATGSVFVDHTTDAQTGSSTFVVAWGTQENGDILYVGHPDIQFDQINIVITVSGDAVEAVWEYYNGDYDDGSPTSVTNLGSTLEVNVNSILGTDNRSGTDVRVRLNSTGAFEDLVSTFSGGNNLVTTTGFLGQTTPSVIAADYTVGSDWNELTNLVDGSSKLTAAPGSVVVSFDLPQTETDDWQKTTVNGVEGNWIRFRVTDPGATNPTLDTVDIDEGDQYLVFSVTQGIAREDDPLASSTGLPDQSYTLTQSPVVDDANLKFYVDEPPESEYGIQNDLLSSGPNDRHVTIAFDDDGRAAVTFGDGVNGKIPPAGTNNIRSEYRTMEEVDGNVGANTITVNKSSISFIDQAFNPRAATGFNIREGTTDEDIARLKISGPATVRTLARAVTPEDAEDLAEAFVDDDGSKPVKRALAVEEAFGPKTVELIAVGAGGATLTGTQLAALEEFFNGDVALKIAGVLLMNSELTASNYSPLSVAVTATVFGGNQEAVETALTGLLSPLALEDDGTTFVFSFGGEVALSKIIATIMNTSPAPRKTTITTPATDVALGARELPVPGTLTITIVA